MPFEKSVAGAFAAVPCSAELERARDALIWTNAAWVAALLVLGAASAFFFSLRTYRRKKRAEAPAHPVP